MEREKRDREKERKRERENVFERQTDKQTAMVGL